MTKKLRAHSKRRGHKKGPVQNEPEAHQNDPFTHPQDGFSGSISAEHISEHTKKKSNSGASTSRRPGGENHVPLTNRNLQTLLEQNDPGSRHCRKSPVALNMDVFVLDQPTFEHAHDHELEDVRSVYSLKSRDSLLLEFGALNPSLDHLSDLTSLDDVCFPDYYEGLRDNGTLESATWPDLLILEEFIEGELDELKEQMQDVPPGVNFQFPVAREVASRDKPADRAPQLASHMCEVLHTTDESPFLNSVHVDETTLMRLGSLSLRVRPKAIQPWEKSREKVPTILNNAISSNQQRNAETAYRFTYFREDIAGTIHSPTLSGLVTDANTGMDLTNEHVLQKLRFLFAPNTLQDPAAKGSVSEMAPVNANPETHTPTPTTASSSNANANLNMGVVFSNGLLVPSHTRNFSLKLDSALPPSIAENHILAPSTHSEKHTAPFWLDIIDPLEEEMKVLSKTFGLHPLTTEDIFLGETREKVELFRQYYFICFTSFDIVYERRKQRAMENEKKHNKLMELDLNGYGSAHKQNSLLRRMKRRLFGDDSRSGKPALKMSVGQSTISKNNRIRSGELCPLNMYMIIFETGVLTFHFNATPHPINVRRRARMLKDHLTVSTDWICYALIDDITDSFAPMIDSIELEVYNIEDEIMRMHSGDGSDDGLDDLDENDLDLSDREFTEQRPNARRHSHLKNSPQNNNRNSTDVFYKRQRSKSIVEPPKVPQFLRNRLRKGSGADYVSLRSEARTKLTRLSSSKSTLSKILAWKRKGDMLRRIGECRKRVMSVMRLLSAKADVIKGFSKRFSENEALSGTKGGLQDAQNNSRLALKQEILMYLGDIQDHVVTMNQSLNHYEKLLARSHSNYLAQLNIDMTKVNNDTNDILGKVTILGTILLPINVVTGLWGMNCIVPGQNHEGLTWFNSILVCISAFSILSYIYARKVTGL